MQAARYRVDPAPALATILPSLAAPSPADETNHRVANSLQLLCALIAVEERDTRDLAALAVLERTRQRISAIAAVHRQLYTAAHSSVVDLGAYLALLAGQIACTCPDHRRVIVEVDAMLVDAGVASSIGLRKLGAGRFEFCVEDRGRGDASTIGAVGLGSRLIAATVRKLEGLASWEDAHPGLRFRLIVVSQVAR